MTRGGSGSDPFGGTDGGGEGGGDRQPGGGGDAEGDWDLDAVDGLPFGGWIPPEHRIWRHPSEVSPLGSGSTLSAGSGVARPGGMAGAGRPRRGTRQALGMAMVGTGAAAAVAAGIVLLEAGGPAPIETQRVAVESTVTVAVTRPMMTSVRTGTSGTEQGMVMITSVSPRGETTSCGVAVAAGGLIVTTADAVTGGSSVTAMTASGQQEQARVVAMDPASDIALLQVQSNLPVPRFIDEAEVHSGNPAMVMAITTASPSGPSRASGASGMTVSVIPTMWAGTIETVGTPVSSGGSTGMATISADIAPPSVTDGAVLVRPDGAVLGILDRTDSMKASNGTTMYLPSDLVLGVAGELRTAGRIRHGWLDIDGQNVAAGPGRDYPGVLVDRVLPGGAADSLLEPGDVIEAVDGTQVVSMAELRAAIYLLEPGSLVDLSVVRDGQSAVVSVVLGRSP